ncbi:hypothetical protein IG631_09298 [Alternaria alternata]|nr:hypothetical protein IG631_09298 [Alternaria alternata]
MLKTAVRCILIWLCVSSVGHSIMAPSTASAISKPCLLTHMRHHPHLPAATTALPQPNARLPVQNSTSHRGKGDPVVRHYATLV